MKSCSSFLVSMLCASVALAEPPASAPSEIVKAASQLVHKQLLEPLKKAESKRQMFSRVARPVALQRRIRVLDAQAQTDARGKHFVRFAVDVRRRDDERNWTTDAVRGCAYPDDDEVFVQRGDRYLLAAGALGEDEAPRPDVCVPAEPRVPDGG